jgi:capsid portal protein
VCERERGYNACILRKKRKKKQKKIILTGRIWFQEYNGVREYQEEKIMIHTMRKAKPAKTIT